MLLGVTFVCGYAVGMPAKEGKRKFGFFLGYLT